MKTKMLHTSGVRKVLALLVAFAMLFLDPMSIVATTLENGVIDTSLPVVDTGEAYSAQIEALTA
jgi:hypothetical protein